VIALDTAKTTAETTAAALVAAN
jgi:hypothetical protein